MEPFYKYIDLYMNDSSKLTLLNISARYGPEYALQACSESTSSNPPIPIPYSIFNSTKFRNITYGDIQISAGDEITNAITNQNNQFILSFNIGWPNYQNVNLYAIIFRKDANNFIRFSFSGVEYYSHSNHYTDANYNFFPDNDANTNMQYQFYYNGTTLYCQTFDFSLNRANSIVQYELPLLKTNNTTELSIINNASTSTFYFEPGEEDFVSTAFTSLCEENE